MWNGEDRGEDLDEVEVFCPVDGHEAMVRLAWLEAEHELAAVEWCSRFGDEPVTCDQSCVRRPS